MRSRQNFQHNYNLISSSIVFLVLNELYRIMFLKAQMPHLNPGICQLIATPEEINAADLTFISAFL